MNTEPSALKKRYKERKNQHSCAWITIQTENVDFFVIYDSAVIRIDDSCRRNQDVTIVMLSLFIRHADQIKVLK